VRQERRKNFLNRVLDRRSTDARTPCRQCRATHVRLPSPDRISPDQIGGAYGIALVLAALDICRQSASICGTRDMTPALALFSHIIDNFFRPNGLNILLFSFILAHFGPIPSFPQDYLDPRAKVENSAIVDSAIEISAVRFHENHFDTFMVIHGSPARTPDNSGKAHCLLRRTILGTTMMEHS
jgi:hypothetical protein